MTETKNPSEMTREELEQLASQLLQDLHSVMAQVPGLTLPHATRQRLSGPAVNVPVQAIEAGLGRFAANSARLDQVGSGQICRFGDMVGDTVSGLGR